MAVSPDFIRQAWMQGDFLSGEEKSGGDFMFPQNLKNG
jgi:hypothetical protein